MVLELFRPAGSRPGRIRNSGAPDHPQRRARMPTTFMQGEERFGAAVVRGGCSRIACRNGQGDSFRAEDRSRPYQRHGADRAICTAQRAVGILGHGRAPLYRAARRPQYVGDVLAVPARTQRPWGQQGASRTLAGETETGRTGGPIAAATIDSGPQRSLLALALCLKHR